MATSSIFSNIIVNSNDSVQAIVTAFENLQKEPNSEIPSIDIRKASDSSNISRVLRKLKKSK